MCVIEMCDRNYSEEVLAEEKGCRREQEEDEHAVARKGKQKDGGNCSVDTCPFRSRASRA